MPIKFVRSLTDTNIIFAIPKPPTKIEKPPIIQPAIPIISNKLSKPLLNKLVSLRAKLGSAIGFIGGFFGLLLTYIITILGKDAVGMDIGLTGTNIILGFTISILIGIISGFIPAYSASQLDPVEAIRTN